MVQRKNTLKTLETFNKGKIKIRQHKNERQKHLQ